MKLKICFILVLIGVMDTGFWWRSTPIRDILTFLLPFLWGGLALTAVVQAVSLRAPPSQWCLERPPKKGYQHKKQQHNYG